MQKDFLFPVGIGSLFHRKAVFFITFSHLIHKNYTNSVYTLVHKNKKRKHIIQKEMCDYVR